MKRVIQPANSRPPAAPITPGILIGETLFLSGSIGTDPTTGALVAGGFERELRQIFTNIQAVLKAGGMDISDVVSVTAYLTDIADYDRFNQIYREHFVTQPLPTRTTVGIRDLALGASVELTMTAVSR